ncbi:UDP-N-acetylmuramoyl-L-alanyl-D-glutamate--2,6-diaminopimelate ligase [Planococcus lenghuensis]|uniref:UDP-N-acetylmuramyl-tripeptide synthetase n=1 Tax=Planococcus lenghuensis TaxID=2213202 RepID=A0A1Q2L4W2_9BACL|nr:UDP-N-acetylmuramoyl-L-alanyl-D-glutamate--2,6-diaminopimelate ligase [Planococcus lenghuensis]AQQ55453.1 UDP-N-acetylmuramoyl-L-alanyl-D-glutamate--2,6-diaminopimelate ligase [Planococcus lenghuensis]
MKLSTKDYYALGIKQIYGNSERTISSITYDSRKTKRGGMFFCLTGENHDGHQFIEQAIQNGADVIIGTKGEILRRFYSTYPECTFMVTDDTRMAMGLFSAAYYDQVHRQLKTVAVTGTNGKTTVTAFVRSLLNQAGITTGSIGTAGVWNHEKKLDFEQTTNTTPESPDLHAIFNRFIGQGVEAAALEVTSIAIEQQRAAGTTFDIGVHTNLTPEHLEFHKTFENYKQAKLKLFDQVKKAVVNVNDAGMSDVILTRFRGPLFTYGIDKPADVMATKLEMDERGTAFQLHLGPYRYQIRAPIFGDYNVSNLLAAICVCLHFGIPANDIIKAIPHIKGPEGRFEVIEHQNGYKIIMDYAHTPDGLEKVLSVVQHFDYRRLILMISGIGLRSPEKRPQMAAVAETAADEVIVTVDHPGFFDRKKILNDVFKGFRRPGALQLHQEPERKKAIHTAMSLAKPGDLVLLTGLGFGGYQVIGDQKIPYSENESIESFHH